MAEVRFVRSSEDAMDSLNTFRIGLVTFALIVGGHALASLIADGKLPGADRHSRLIRQSSVHRSLASTGMASGCLPFRSDLESTRCV